MVVWMIKASFIMITKKGELTNILVREDRRVWLNFGSDLWIEFQDLINTKIFTKDNSKNKKYKDWIKSKKFKKDYKDTIKVIDESENYDEITKKFIQDFKKDRSNRIWRQELEIDQEQDLNKLEVKK